MNERQNLDGTKMPSKKPQSREDREQREKRRARMRAIRIRKARNKMIMQLSAVVVVAIVVVSFLGYKIITGMVSDTATVNEDNIEEVIVEESKEPVTVKITAVGDCTFGTDVSYGMSGSFMEMYDAQGPEYFLSKVKYLFEEDDITIINMEGTLTEDTSQIVEKRFNFRGEPEYVEIMTSSSVEAANLANNHSYDYGQVGYEDTVRNIDESGVASFGLDRIAYMDIEGVKVALVGIYAWEVGAEAKDEVIIRMTEAKDNGANLIITSFHWGEELDESPVDYQVMLGQTAIDYGSDLVVGHHPHIIQGMDEYKGKYIFYSLGNFSFGGNRNPNDKDSLIYQQSFTLLDGEIIDTSVNLIPCSVTSVTSKNNFQPMVSEGTEKTRIAEKIIERSMIDVSAFIS